MGGEWVTRRIGSLGRVVTGKTPSTADPSNFGGPYPFITIPDLDGRVLIDCSERTLSETAAETLRSSLLPPGSVMMSCIATVGRCGITAKPSFTNQQINSVIPTDDTDPRFLYYVFTQLGHELESAGGGGSVYTNVSKSRFSEIEVELPEDVNEQGAIAHIIGTLDDKTELNRRMNETLETIARAIFKSWFVNFDPVRAKAEGRDPGLPKHIADLFPDRFENCALAEIPEGWKVGSILQPTQLLSGGTPKTERREYWDGNIFWASAKDVSQCGQTFLVTTERTITKNGLEESATQLIPAFSTGVVARGATTGRMVMFGRQMAMNQTCYALTSTSDTPFALYCQLRHEMESLVHAAHGSVFDTITTSTFANSKVVLPPAELPKVFEQRVSPIFHRILENTQEVQTLAALRDRLLPKLISGEVRVPHLTRIAGSHKP